MQQKVASKWQEKRIPATFFHLTLLFFENDVVGNIKVITLVYSEFNIQ